MLKEKSRNTLREIYPSATFSSIDLTWTALGLNPYPDPLSEKLAIQQLRCYMTTLYTVAYVLHWTAGVAMDWGADFRHEQDTFFSNTAKSPPPQWGATQPQWLSKMGGWGSEGIAAGA